MKDVFKGDNSVRYTFSNTLGNNSIAVLSYYLSSPFNLLLVLFKKKDIHVFFSVAVMLKLALSGGTCAWYIENRFGERMNTVLTILMSVSYSLMQYSLLQAHNIMWLDGVYMLPLIMLGIYRAIHESNIHVLSIYVGMSIVFNWYTGGINCLFAVIYFIFESLLYIHEEKPEWRMCLKICIRAVISMVLGVMMSCVTFLPSVFALKSGKGEEFDWSWVTNTLSGNPINVISNSTIGSVSSRGNVTLFCGSLVLLGVIAFFSNSKVSYIQKLITGMFLFFSIMICYYTPFEFVFSLLKRADSYWYRYSYVSIFALIVIACLNYSNIDRSNYYIKCFGIYFVICLIVMLVNANNEFNNYLTFIFGALIAVVLDCINEE